MTQKFQFFKNLQVTSKLFLDFVGVIKASILQKKKQGFNMFYLKTELNDIVS